MRDDDKKNKYEKPRILIVPAFDEERYDHMMEDRMADFEPDYDDEQEEE